MKRLKNLQLLTLLVGLFLYQEGIGQSMTYRNSFDISQGASLNGNNPMNTETSWPNGLTFNNDGTKYYVVEIATDQILQYSMSSAYDVTTASYDGAFSVAGQDTQPSGIAFNGDGSKVFIVGNSNSIHRYSLTTNYDVTNTVTYDNVSLGGLSNAQDIEFSPDGMKLFYMSSSVVFQYSLTSAYDISASTLDGSYSSSTDLPSHNLRTMAFGQDGSKLFLLGITFELVAQLDLTIPYDITGGITYSGKTFDVGDEDGDPSGLAFNPDGSRLYMVGAGADRINQYDLNAGQFSEVDLNDGNITGTGGFQVAGDEFNNAGSSLTQGVHYSISNLPSGLSTSIDVGANGLYGTLNITGSASNNQDANDVAGLIFTFNNAAFVGGDASSVSNSASANSGISIDFTENNPAVSYDFSYDFSSLTQENSLVTSTESSPSAIRFSNDGFKLFVTGSISDDIHQYTLQNAFDISSSTYNGFFSVAAQEPTPQDFAFSSDGMKMFVLGNNRLIYQYSLTSAFVVTSGVTYDNASYSVVSQESSPTGMEFSPDGMKLFVVGRNGDEVNQYSLTNAFDISSGVSPFGSPFSISSQTGNPYAIIFNGDGTRMLISGSGGFIHHYELPGAYDITSGVTFSETYDLSSIGRFPNGIQWSSDGSKFFLVDSDPDRIYQFGTPISGFAEDDDNLGVVEGQLPIDLVDDFFTNAGGTLVESTHFTIPNKPAGLTASIAVDANGQNATLTLTGTATSHQAVNTISSLTLNFLNAAFMNSNAADVANAVNATTNVSLEFRDNNKEVFYGSAFKLDNAVYDAPGFLSGTYVAFDYNDDGSRLFLIQSNNNRVYQIIPGDLYDPSAGLTFGDNFIASDMGTVQGIEFNSDGTRMFLLDLNNMVGQYNLSSGFDITTASFIGSYDVSAQETGARALAFNAAGTKMYVSGRDSDEIHQYSLSTPFNIQSGVTYDGSPLNIQFQDTEITDITFEDNGNNMYITGYGSDEVHHFELSTPYDITSGVTYIQGLDVSGQTSFPYGVFVTPSGGSLQLLSTSGNDVSLYDLGAGGFTEISDNNGEVEGDLTVYIVDEKFSNAGGNLTLSTDYTLGNVPAGLTPNLTVAADGFSATLTLSGTADDHQDSHDVSSIGFNFNNSAFVGGNASEVTNATSAESGIGIDFEDNNSTLSYGYGFSLANGAEVKNLFKLNAIEDGPQNIAFSSDGLKMFIVGIQNTAVLQFSLSNPYSVGFGVTLDGSFDLSGFDVIPTGLTFNASGTKMYVSGGSNNSVYQFSLTTPFQVTSGVTHDGTPITSISWPRGMAFNNDGSGFILQSGVGSSVYRQYELTTPYDLTAGTTLVKTFTTSNSNPRGIAFSDNGFTMFAVNFNDIVLSYDLAKPFDLRVDPVPGDTYDANADVFWTSGIAFSSSGDRMILVGDQSSLERVVEFDLNVGGFTETIDNSGEVEGSIVIRAFDAQFANGGSTLATPADYTVTGVPAGLTPQLTVAADGFSATLTLSGSANNHQNVNDTDDFTFTFNDSAFETLAASLVNNASSHNSELGVDFRDNLPGIRYGNAFDVLAGTSYSDNSFFTGGDPSDVTFSPDGTKMFVTNFTDVLTQYTLSTPFDVTSATADSPTFGFNAAEVTVGIAFSSDGMKMYALSNFNLIHQYSLTNAFDITSGVTDDGTPLDISNQETSPAGIFLSPDGTKLFTVGGGSDNVNQYSLANPFDISSGVTYDSSPVNVSSQDLTPVDLAFSQDGRIMFVLGINNDQVQQYRLAIPFDITTGVTHQGGFSVLNEEGQSSGLEFSSKGDKLFVVGRDENTVYEYDLNVGSFDETAINDGDVEGTVTIYISDDQFTNGGSTLTHTSDYTITNLPAGLTPTLTVAADGFSASLTITGQVANHQEANSVDALEFTFANSAFVTNNAADVDNAVSANSNLAINLRDNNPALTYGDFYDFVNASHDGIHSIAEDDLPTNVTFSSDGLKMFITGRRNDAIYQYSLTNPFEVTSGVSHEGMLDISVETRDAMDLQFSPDGMTLLVLSDNISSSFGSLIAQYDLTQPYNITSGVTYSGNSVDVSDRIAQPSGFTFTPDGTRVFITNGFHSSERIYYYTLNSAYDISGGMTYDDDYRYEVPSESLYDLSFNRDGTSLFLLVGPLSDQIVELELGTPYDLTGSVDLGSTFSVTSEEDFPQGFIFGPNGNKLYVIGSTGDEVNQYTLTDDGFVENNANDGSIDGSLDIRIVDDFFINAGGNLNSPTNYEITNLPAGLTSSLNVSVDGLTATLTLGGNATSNLNSDDLASLEFTFENSAFVTSDAVDVENSVVSSGVGINFLASTETDILTFTLPEETGASTIDVGNHTVDIEVVFGTDLTNLTPTFTISDGAMVSPASNVSRDFTNSVTYTITAEDGTVQDWDVTVNIAPNTENDIETFTFGEINGAATIDDGGHTVTAEAVVGTDISSIAPTITVSENGMINPNSGATQDFTSTVNYTVTAEDGTPQGWNVTITEALAPPTDISLNSTSIDENTSSGTVVGTLTSTDASFNDSHTYMLVAGIGDDDNGSFTTVGNELRSIVSFDFETKDTYFIRVQTDDGNGGLFDKAFTISVNDVNEIPTDISLDNLSIDESNPVGSVIGTFTTTDVDQGQTYTYSLVAGIGSDDNTSFDISGDQLVSNEVFDFETKTNYTVRIQTDDQNGGTYEEAFAISINDIPASVTSVLLSDNSVDENAVSGTTVGTLSTTGEDLSGSYTYMLVAGTGDADNSSFDISGSDLITMETFDFETKSSYSIRVQSDDGIGNIGAFQLTISINDVSEAPTDISLDVSSIIENNSINDVIGSFSTTDVDAGESYTYTLVAGTGDTDNASFDISTDDLLTSEVFDFETKSSYSIRVQTDDGNGGLFEKSFTITIIDENESILLVNPLGDLVLDEGFATQNVDASNVFSDQDGDALTYSVSSSNTSIVTVSNSGANLTITEAGGFGSSTITVTADDGSGVTTSDDFVVTVNEVFSTETDITAFSLAEQTGPATIDASNHTVNIEVALGTAVTALNPTIEVSPGATYIPIGGQNFANGSVVYTVTAEDGSTTQDWIVTVTVEPDPLSSETDITAFSFTEQTGAATIDATNHSVSIEVANGTDVSSLTPSITVSAGATVSPTGAQDFTNAVTYTITAEDELTTQDWIVTVTVEPDPLSMETDITAFSFTEQTGAATIDAANHTVSIEVANGTDVTSLTPTITVSSGATVSPTGAQDFTNAVTYTVTAEDGSTTQDWVVTVTVEELALGLEDEIQIDVYPNPTSDFVRIISDQTLTVKVMDLKGMTITQPITGKNVTIDVRTLSQGTYLLQILGDEVNTTRRFIKIN